MNFLNIILQLLGIIGLVAMVVGAIMVIVFFVLWVAAKTGDPLKKMRFNKLLIGAGSLAGGFALLFFTLIAFAAINAFVMQSQPLPSTDSGTIQVNLETNE